MEICWGILKTNVVGTAFPPQHTIRKERKCQKKYRDSGPNITEPWKKCQHPFTSRVFAMWGKKSLFK